MRQRGAEQTDWGHCVPRVCVSQRGREKQTSWYCIALLCPRNYFTCSTAHSKKKKMSKTDAIAIFAEGTFQDQVRLDVGPQSVNIVGPNVTHRSPSSQSTSRRADRSRNAHRMSNRSDKSSPSRTARRRYRRMSRGEERRSLSCLGTSRGWARARSAVASQLSFFSL
jgi:hypothetical protein